MFNLNDGKFCFSLELIDSILQAQAPSFAIIDSVD